VASFSSRLSAPWSSTANCFENISCRSRPSSARPSSPHYIRRWSRRNISLRAARRRNRTADRDFPLVARRKRFRLSAFASRHRRARESHCDRIVSLVRPKGAWIRLRSERLNYRPRRESDLHMRAKLGSNVVALQMNTTIVDHDASAMSLNLHLGGKYSRFESLSRLSGEGGRSDLLAIFGRKRHSGV